jgi:ABC-type uncharacterized transport system substrate-binding protein
LGGGRLSAIYLDQPFSRRFALIKHLIPNVKEVGVVLGPNTKQDKSSLVGIARAYGFRLNIEVIQNESQLVPALESVLKRSQVMLAVLDPLVFNRSNAQTVLLTAYRYRVPIIGISSAYIEAGALAAVYSTPEDIGKQVTMVIRRYFQQGQTKLPASQYSEYFSIKVNEPFARKLDIRIINNAELKRRLKKQTRMIE